MTDTVLLNLAAAAAVLTRLVRVDDPVIRYAWWRGVLLVCLALPLVQPWQPPGGLSLGMLALDAPSETALAATVPAVPGPVPAIAPAARIRWAPLVAILLVTGTVLRLAWLAAGLTRLRRIRRTGVAATAGPDLLRELHDAGADVRSVASIHQPVTFGVLRPVVLLPETLAALSPEVQRAVLAHELWHVRRRDWLWSIGEEVLLAALWFHPAIWYLVSRVQCAREEVVDELSILLTNSRRGYLEALLAFADAPAVYPAASFTRRRQLFNRMLLISREGVMSPRRIVASSIAMAGALVLTGWYSALAFPLTAPAGPVEPQAAQSQAQPRDPRPAAPRPVTSREQVVKAATVAEPSDVKKWLELAKLQEDRGALQEAEATYQAGLAGTSGAREILMAQARFYTRTGQFDRAMRILEDAAAQNPGDASGHQLVATYYWEKAQKDQSLTPADKLMYIESGIRATDNALAQRADYVEALTYKNILLRMKGNMETDATRRQQLFAEADTLRGRAMELQKQRIASGAAAAEAAAAGAPPPPPPPPPPPLPQDYQVDGQQPVRVGGDIKTPVKLRDVRPVYPAEAQQARVSGMVVIEAVIDTQGDVRAARVLRSVPLLDQAALDAVRQWQFAPTVRDGAPVPVIMTVTVNFTLQ
jgi:TonB family protein